MPLSIRAIPVLSDNYAWLLHDEATGQTAIVDPGEAAPIQKTLKELGLGLDLILLTHHHSDHIDGARTLRDTYKSRIVGPKADVHRLPPLDQAVEDGDTLALGNSTAQVLAVPGHTSGHIAYYFTAPPALFCGDTLFSLGCGRLFEGTPEQMFTSLHRFDTLPDETLVCCGHEYTLGNAAFALHADPHNTALQARVKDVKALRAAGQPTLPSTLGLERQTNPFLRAKNSVEFAKLRREKDTF
ncbi:hydroxyacylglutathione hydrolase [Acetobacter cibinongensis]|uniref:Hydroxyacylglutathione hydrolase n=1 Tax=Acetobacter cibinongensis TaxID=146475 RepID=A0A0D6N2F1_9PROT|nr:hydroxyacylglutathione hydrolase [Acetobacter cibinongensis]GAN60192.1 hydroxyacylglutathione hydrolase [Acetobacter cibinongensis]GBQ18033.1 hydroxyacylglutathione hydrolase [Acetobacter cibinongensis NRIC 0482]GEL58312.1 hydroxyacylglutathione hydrolase [Acetobacter cibinongensis]